MSSQAPTFTAAEIPPTARIGIAAARFRSGAGDDCGAREDQRVMLQAASKPPQKFPPGPGTRVPGKLALQFRRDVLGFLTKIAREHGDIVSFNSALHRFYIFNHPDG